MTGQTDGGARIVALEGETAELFRRLDWASTPLGPVSSWSPTLVSTVNLILPAGAQIVLFWGPQLVALYNDAYAPAIGDRHPRALGRPARENWAELWDDLEPLLKTVWETRKTYLARDRPFRIARAGGLVETVYFDVSFSVVTENDGSVCGVLCIVGETTQRVLGDQALRLSEERVRLATENAEVGLWEIGPEQTISFLYAQEKGAFSMPQDRRTPAAEFFAHVHPEDAPAVMRAYEAARDPKTRSMIDIEYRTLAMGNAPARWVAIKGRGIFDADGNCVRMSGTAVDITKRRLAERALRLSEEQLRLATELADVGLWDVDVVTGELYWPPRVNVMFGFAPETKVTLADFRASIHTDDRRRVTGAMLESCDPAKRVPYDIEYRIRRNNDGAVRWMAVKGRAVFDDGDRCTRMLGIIIDVTGRKEIEERLKELNESLEVRVAERTAALERSQAALQQAQKMEAIGNLTGGIAHDFNNLLQGVAGSLDLIRRKPHDTERVRRWAEAGLSASERGVKLTAQLLAFSRSQKLELKPLDLSRLVRGLRELLSSTLGPSIPITIESDIRPATVIGDETQLELAVLNLAINARDAMPDGGDLAIALSSVRVMDDPELAPGDYIALSVTDSGTGMSAEVAARAFDPFFTTKGVGKGTGLGLSQVYGMACQAGGIARIRTAPGEGTTVSIFLRQTSAAAIDQFVRGENREARVPAPATILVVDDDPDVRRFLSDSLDSLGYAVIEAEDGQAGLLALGQEVPGLMLVDYAMPGMTGAELARRVRALHPELPILFVSGYAETSALENVLGEDTLILRKPFRINELQVAVAGALHR